MLLRQLSIVTNNCIFLIKNELFLLNKIIVELQAFARFALSVY